MSYPPKRNEERFWPKVRKTTSCWLWVGHKDKKGYGEFYVFLGSKNYKTCRAHRFSYELLNEKIPDGLVLDHLCRVPLCVNPKHLEPVTIGENIRRGFSISTLNSLKTKCPKEHPYSGENLATNNRGDRVCRTCRNERSHESRRRLSNDTR